MPDETHAHRDDTDTLLIQLALGLAGSSGQALFASIVQYLAATLEVDLAFVGRALPDNSGHMQTLAVSLDGRISDNLEYAIEETPCREVLGRGFHFVRHGVAEAYPGDNMLNQLALSGYAGCPLNASNGRPLGVIAVLHRQALPDRERVETILNIFASRAASELERLEADEARKCSDISYRAIFEASEDCIFVHDFDTGAIVDVNPAACRAYGYSREEFMSLTPGDLGSGEPPYTLEGAAAWIDAARQGMPVRVEWHRRNKDGSLHWDEVVLRRAIIGGVRRILAFTREITDRKLREDALVKSEDRMRAVVEAALDCIIGMDADGNIIEFNPAAEHCFGYSREDVLGKPLAEVVIPERHRAAHQAGLAHHLATGVGPFLGRRVNVTARRASGEEFPAELAIDVARGPNGPIYIGYLRDISLPVRAEAERQRLETQLRQAQKMEAIGQLAGGIAHDFNNILTSILGYVVLVMDKLEARGDTKLAGYLDNAHQSGLRARDLIRQLLTFSRGQRGTPRPLDLSPHVQEAIRLLGASLPSSMSIGMSFAPDTRRVMLDPVQIEQILMNLCINARDAMQGRGRLEIAVSGHEQLDGVSCASCRQTVCGKFVELSVRDSGPGIAPEVMERMFEPFFSTKEAGKGSGMGLAMVHGIVHEHGGHILIEQMPDGGANFRILLPALDESVQECNAGHDTRPAAPMQPGSDLSGRVLIVDDEDAVGQFMRDLLTEWGMRVTLFNNALAARDEFARAPHAFDLAVLDQTMPGLTGLELAQDMLLLRPDLPIALYTGYRESLSDEEIEAIGIRALIRKPIDTAALRALFESLLPAA